MIRKLVLAAVVGVTATLVCVLVGTLLIAVNVSLAVTIGSFLKDWAAAIGILAAIWFYFTNGDTFPRRTI